MLSSWCWLCKYTVVLLPLLCMCIQFGCVLAHAKVTRCVWVWVCTSVWGHMGACVCTCAKVRARCFVLWLGIAAVFGNFKVVHFLLLKSFSWKLEHLSGTWKKIFVMFTYWLPTGTGSLYAWCTAVGSDHKVRLSEAVKISDNSQILIIIYKVHNLAHRDYSKPIHCLLYTSPSPRDGV